MRLLHILLFCVVTVPFAEASTWSSYHLNKEALRNFKEEAYGQSLQNLIQALESEPMNPKIHLNLGMALLAMGEPEKAAKAFSSAASLTSNPEERFVALFNEGYAAGEAKQIEQALQAYQKALEIEPDSVEVKTNIELLMSGQQNNQGQGEGQNNQDNKEGSSQGDSSDEGDNPEKKENDQGQGQQQQQQQPQPQKPQQFKSKELTASDVKKILEELKSQEQGIRAKEYEKGPKERPSGKDW